jgi:hypothetical protein
MPRHRNGIDKRLAICVGLRRTQRRWTQREGFMIGRIPYEPAPLSGQNGPFDPFTGGSFPFPFGRW